MLNIFFCAYLPSVYPLERNVYSAIVTNGVFYKCWLHLLVDDDEMKFIFMAGQRKMRCKNFFQPIWASQSPPYSMYSASALTRPVWETTFFLILVSYRDHDTLYDLFLTCRSGLCKRLICHLMNNFVVCKTCGTVPWPLTGPTVLKSFWKTVSE